MFVLSEIHDTIGVHPSQFARPAIDAISEQINRKFANKVLQDVGLCVSLYDLLDCSDGKVRWGDGYLYYTVEFRLIVFRPFINQVLLGRIKSSDETGIRISLGFFDDIYIPCHLIPTPCAFDHQERAFFWLYEARTLEISQDPLLSNPDERMYLDTGEWIRFSVESDQFFDAEPGPTKVATTSTTSTTTTTTTSTSNVNDTNMMIPGAASVDVHHRETALVKESRPHYSLTCSIAGQGLGLVSWWAGAKAEQQPDTQDYVYHDPSNPDQLMVTEELIQEDQI